MNKKNILFIKAREADDFITEVNSSLFLFFTGRSTTDGVNWQVEPNSSAYDNADSVYSYSALGGDLPPIQKKIRTPEEPNWIKLDNVRYYNSIPAQIISLCRINYSYRSFIFFGTDYTSDCRF
ncbi:hypothetical protein BFL38_00685 [Brachyspira hampsonii]|uniref:Uncharacterized protein n=1 Tax=Brachyspira hampsonii TaxID=1287055 RepID=A0A1E5NAD4_9SPIR|nr:hypothetical protein BFL38_00685 [Brachyspira hampsonii]